MTLFWGGERDAAKLADLRESQVRASAETIIKALEGDYREEHLFTLRQSLTLYRFVQSQIVECQKRIRQQFSGWKPKIDAAVYQTPRAIKKIRVEGLTSSDAENLREHSYRILGVDLTRVDGINGGFLQVFLSEVGRDMSQFRSGAAFASWLKLSPNPRVSGGKVLKSKTQRNTNRLATAFRLAGNALFRSQSALGDCFRRGDVVIPEALACLQHALGV